MSHTLYIKGEAAQSNPGKIKFLHSHYLVFVPHIGDVSSKRLMEMVTSSNLNSSEIQALIDVLLNKQGENSQWKKV